MMGTYALGRAELTVVDGLVSLRCVLNFALWQFSSGALRLFKREFVKQE